MTTPMHCDEGYPTAGVFANLPELNAMEPDQARAQAAAAAVCLFECVRQRR